VVHLSLPAASPLPHPGQVLVLVFAWIATHIVWRADVEAKKREDARLNRALEVGRYNGISSPGATTTAQAKRGRPRFRSRGHRSRPRLARASPLLLLLVLGHQALKHAELTELLADLAQTAVDARMAEHASGQPLRGSADATRSLDARMAQHASGRLSRNADSNRSL